MRDSVCLLTLREVKRFENYDILPNCCEHRHTDVAGAIQLVKSDTHREYGSDFNLHAVIEQDNNNRVWKNKDSGTRSLRVKQLVSL